MYAIKLQDNKVVSWQIVSKEYVAKFKNDSSSPLNMGYILVESLEGYEMAKLVVKTEKERILETLELTEIQLEKIKKL